MDEVRNEVSDVTGAVVQVGSVGRDVTVYVGGEHGAGSLVVTVDRSVIEELLEFADEPGLFHGWSRHVGLVVESRGARAVVLTGLRAVVAARRAPRPVGRRGVMAGSLEPGGLTVDFDRDPPCPQGKGLSVTVSAGQPQRFTLDLVVREHEVDWHLELDWVADGKRGVFRVPDTGYFTHRPPGTTADGLAGEVLALLPGQTEPVLVGPGPASPQRIGGLLDEASVWINQVRSNAGVIVAIDPRRATGLARRLSGDSIRDQAEGLMAMIRALGPADPEMARRLAVETDRLVRKRGSFPNALPLLATAVRDVDVSFAKRLLADAESQARVPNKFVGMKGSRWRENALITAAGTANALAALAAAWWPLDRQRARALAQDAERESLYDRMTPVEKQTSARELMSLARTLAGVDREWAERVVRESRAQNWAAWIGAPGVDARWLIEMVTALHDKASVLENAAGVVDENWLLAQTRALVPQLSAGGRVRLLTRVAAAVGAGTARSLIAEAERELEAVFDPRELGRASIQIARAVAVHDPDRAERLANDLEQGERAIVLVAVAKTLHERTGQRVVPIPAWYLYESAMYF